MRTYSLSHLADQTLLQNLATLVARDRTNTAALLAHLAEVDSRRLYAPAGYPSMYAYCVGELHLSEDAACKRIQVARIARHHPMIFEALAEGGLHMTAVLKLSPYLRPENADELLAAAAHTSKAGLELLIAERFPATELLPIVEALPASSGNCGDRLAPVGSGTECRVLSAPERIELRSSVVVQAPERFALHVTVDKETHDALRHAQELLSHQIPTGDVAAVLKRSLLALVAQLERRKFAATSRPRRAALRASSNPRHIPAAVKRAVWKRDGGRCTFVSHDGCRCTARTLLEYDHMDPVARGGQATVDRMRLRCRAHNQLEAERAFGSEFMREKRAAARNSNGASAANGIAGHRAVLQSASRPSVSSPCERAAAAVEPDRDVDVVPWLRRLGFSAAEGRRAATFCESMTGASLEARVRAALSLLAPASARRAASSSGGAP